MNNIRMQRLVAFASGLLFGLGLALGGMTQPAKVIGFLDVMGDWDASLMFVMLGAIGVHFAVYRWAQARPAPFFAHKFASPTRRDIDAKLVAGAALFGVGWGLGGYCPGPGIVALASGNVGPVVFVLAMLVGLFATGKLEARFA